MPTAPRLRAVENGGLSVRAEGERARRLTHQGPRLTPRFAGEQVMANNHRRAIARCSCSRRPLKAGGRRAFGARSPGARSSRKARRPGESGAWRAFGTSRDRFARDQDACRSATSADHSAAVLQKAGSRSPFERRFASFDDKNFTRADWMRLSVDMTSIIALTGQRSVSTASPRPSR